jgi:hypothetical protein
MESITLERCFDWLRDERHVSPMISAAATLNRKPSARKFAPFSMALGAGTGRSVDSVTPIPGKRGPSRPTYSLRAGEYAWQVRPAGRFVTSLRCGTWSERGRYTNRGSVRVFRLGVSLLRALISSKYV